MYSLQIRNADGREAAFPLCPGRITAGSGELDAVRLESLAPAVLELEISADAVIVAPFLDGTLAGGRPLRFGQRRALRPGERLTLGPHELWFEQERRPADQADATRALALGLLGSALAAAPPPSPFPSLLWLNGPDCGRRLALFEESIVLGRGAGGAIVRVRDALASRRHARLTLDNGQARLTPLNSANGLWIDDEPIREERTLTGGEVLRLGDTEIAFLAPDGTPTPAAPAALEPPAPTPAPEPPPRPRAVKRLTRLEFVALFAASLLGTLGIVAVWLFTR